MKKVFPFVLVVAFISLVVTSCSHDDGYNGPQPANPATESVVIDSFIKANTLPLVPDTISGAPYAMIDLISWGDTTQRVNNDSSLVFFKITGTLMNNQTFVTNSSTQQFDFINTQSNSQLVNEVVFPQSYPNFSIVQFYLEKLGKGGHVLLATPSAYQYATNSITVGSTVIPSNSPIYYDLQIVDVNKTGSAQ